MDVSLFDFDLPEAAIALRPASPRDSAKLLQVAHNGDLSDHIVSDLASLLKSGDVLVLNETKVFSAALKGMRAARPYGGGSDVRIDVNLHTPVDESVWRAFARPAKRLKLYIARKRAPDEKDINDYQTVYASEEGSVAAPTAGLHFTDNVFANLHDKGVQIERLTLHVGAGTFLPVKSDDTNDHKMHEEHYSVSNAVADRINKAKSEGRRIIAVGTTSLRALESAVDLSGEVQPGSNSTDIFMTPGSKFRVIDGLMTNFHLPKSTLFMLVSAIAGLDVMQNAYSHAIQNGYRFYSYGDSSLIWKVD